MKTKIFLLVCIFLGIGLTRLSAQKNNDHSWPWWYGEETVGFFPITCDGVVVDWLDCYGKFHVVDHVVNDVTVWEILKARWTATSDVTGEVFHASELDKYLTPTENQELSGTWRGNLVGNQGSVYQITIAITFSLIPPYPFTWSLIKANCH